MSAASRPLPDTAARTLISARGGRVTRTRVAVIEAMQASAQPLSHDELASLLGSAGQDVDRVTLYRTLDWLVEQGIAQRIASGERAWRFELHHDERHRHAHFHCDHCGQILCLESTTPVPPPDLPAGFAIARTEWVLHGACAGCNTEGPRP
ncbi:MAG: Fur family transcriptional regulator [Thauera sp.]|jgi:Fur family ferric uptake transcriptional regulator|nr:Fur family transcriptional regulator [Thauera sp.]